PMDPRLRADLETARDRRMSANPEGRQCVVIDQSAPVDPRLRADLERDIGNLPDPRTAAATGTAGASA
ncbi:MAG TPA: hypothetical protein VI078_13700, partial [bacterium]